MVERNRHQVLVIDDEREIRETFQDVLMSAGYGVKVAVDGDDGLRVRDRNPVDVLITDVLMPNKDGIETIAEFRKTHPATKIIAVSGGGRSGTMEFLRMARLLGADRALSKPISADELLDTVNDLVRPKARSRRRLRRNPCRATSLATYPRPGMTRR